MSLASDILAKDDAAQTEEIKKQEALLNRPAPTSGKSGDEIKLVDGRMVGAHTGLHYNGKGPDGQTFEDVYGKRKGPQKIDTNFARSKEDASGMVKGS